MATREEIIANAREAVKGLRVNCIDAKPETYDFGSNPFDEEMSEGTWESIEAVECDDCGLYIVEGDDHGYVDENSNAITEIPFGEAGGSNMQDSYTDVLDEWAEANGLERCPRHGDDFREFDQAEGPMMNYRYPLGDRGHFDADDARKIADLPLCIVHFNDSGDDYLALTGGGMDLSWEIAEAYLRLGYLPPTHFRLPAMADKDFNETTALVLAGVERASQIQVNWATNSLEDARRKLGELPDPTDD